MDLQGNLPEESQLLMTAKNDTHMAVIKDKQDLGQIVVHTTDGVELVAANLWPNLVSTSSTHTESPLLDQEKPEKIINSQESMEVSDSETGGELEDGNWSHYKNSRRNRKRRACPVVATRKSSRMSTAFKGASANILGVPETGTFNIPANSFAILNTMNDDDLASIAGDCDVVRGGGRILLLSITP